jgi:hypothetical protein
LDARDKAVALVDVRAPILIGDLHVVSGVQWWHGLAYSGGMALHSASIVTIYNHRHGLHILQTKKIYQNVVFNHQVPCGVILQTLTLKPSPDVPLYVQTGLDDI